MFQILAAVVVGGIAIIGGVAYFINKTNENQQRENEQQQKYKQYEMLAQNIEAYSKNYKGNVNVDTSRAQENINTDYFRNKETAEIYLKGIASEKGFDMVYDMEFFSENKENGNYKYKIWMASGIAAFRKHRP